VRYPISDHCDGERFFNPGVTTDRGPRDLLRWWRTRMNVPWPPAFGVAASPLPAQPPADRVTLTLIGHSTFLIQASGVAILTDPVFTSHAGPLGRLGPKRVRPPSHAIADLPRVDAVLVSHNHYDHLQPRSLREVESRFHPLIVTTLGNRRFLQRLGLRNVVELDWWDRVPIPGGEATCTPAQHFSARGMRDRNRTLWGGFALALGGTTIYFAGDTGYGPIFQEIGRRVPGIDVALVPIGAYEPRWFMSPVHVNPEEAVRIHLDVGARTGVAMHFGTFKLTDEGIDEPVERLALAREAAGLAPGAFVVPEFGRPLVITPGAS
jgi:L-ascorbate metabolism protein UlaG (beta-lactamase superfamily)